MKRLALSMRRDATRIPFGRAVRPPSAALTYFGQFIVHDLTQDDTPLSDRHPPEPTEIVNHRTPFLDLDSVYGRGPFSEDARFYEDDHASFKLGTVRTLKEVPFDVPLDPDTNEALIADDRNNENLIIRQIHAMFLRLHNAAVEELQSKVSGPTLFQKAQERVRQQYQWLVRNGQDGFLVRVCKSEVYDEVVRQGKHTIEWEGDFAIPVEFAHAAGRFGHSMVRAEYNLNKNNHDVPLSRIFLEVHKPGSVEPSLAIDWRKFVGERANSIDTTIVKALFELGPKAIQPFVERIGWIESLKLPVRTLYRNIRMKLPSGEDVRAVLDPEAVLSDPPAEFPDYKPFKTLDELVLRDKTPLWYYILLEAELNERGGNLGVIGSRLVAEVLEGALRATPCSILTDIKSDPTWRPLAWNTPLRLMPIDNLLDLAIVVGLADDSSDGRAI